MQFGFKIVVGPDGHLHVVRPYAAHFSRRGTEPGRAEYVLERGTNRMLWAA